MLISKVQNPSKKRAGKKNCLSNIKDEVQTDTRDRWTEIGINKG